MELGKEPLKQLDPQDPRLQRLMPAEVRVMRLGLAALQFHKQPRNYAEANPIPLLYRDLATDFDDQADGS